MDNQVQIQPSLFMDDEPRNKKKQKINIRISSNILSEFPYIQNYEIIYNVHGMYTKMHTSDVQLHLPSLSRVIL